MPKLQNGAMDWRDYVELCKPRVVALMLLTALVGMALATPEVEKPSAWSRVNATECQFNPYSGIRLTSSHVASRKCDGADGHAGKLCGCLRQSASGSH